MFQDVLFFQTAVSLRKIFHHLQSIMWVGESYKRIQMIFQKSSKILVRKDREKNPSAELVKMAEFILKNNLYEFETKIICKFLEQSSVLSLFHHMHVMDII